MSYFWYTLLGALLCTLIGTCAFYLAPKRYKRYCNYLWLESTFYVQKYKNKILVLVGLKELKKKRRAPLVPKKDPLQTLQQNIEKLQAISRERCVQNSEDSSE